MSYSHKVFMLSCIIIFCASIRAKIRNEVDDYSASTDYWIRCLYKGEEGNPADVEKGFLKSELLVRVTGGRGGITQGVN